MKIKTEHPLYFDLFKRKKRYLTKKRIVRKIVL